MIRFKYIILYIKSLIFYAWRFKRFGIKSIVMSTTNLEHPNKILIGRNVRILKGARMECISKWRNEKFNPEITIGDDVNIGHNFFITCASTIKIGRGTLISDNVAIIDNFHDHKDMHKSASFTPISAKPIIIEENVTIYRNSTILGGVRIGRGAIVGAHSVVKNDVSEFEVVGGVIAKVIKKRFEINEN